ncbi:MAG: efflux transporter outer membrane subunit [Pseudomonadota bacterium]
MARILFVALTAAGLSACASVGPDYERPQLTATDTKWIDRASVPAAEGAFIAWWRDLGDPQLTRLIEASLEENLSVRQALLRVEEARSRRAQVRSAALPSVAADGSVTVLQQSLNANPGLADIPGFVRDFEVYDVGGSLAWQIDLWGQTRRAVEAGGAQIEAAIAAANGARLAVAIETASTYMSLRGFQAERDALSASAAAQEELVRLSRIQLDKGLISRADLLLVESELARIEAQLPALDVEIRAAALALGPLTGGLPEKELSLAAQTSPAIALADVPVGLRADLLRRRPDIARAERELAAQTAQIGVAKAELFPQLRLNVDGGFASAMADTLFDGQSTNYNIVPFISWRIFDGGRVRAEINLAQTEAKRAALAYEESVLAALTETETAIARYDLARTALDLSGRAARLSADNFKLARIQFDKGAIGRLRLQEAERGLRDAQRGRAVAYRQASLAMTGLYAALGGGWQAIPDGDQS